MRAAADWLTVLAVNLWVYVRHRGAVRQYFRRLGHLPNAAKPTSFTEKMLWRKIFDRDPLFVELSDKVSARAWMQVRCPSLAIAPLLWFGERAEAIPDAVLGGGVIVKTTHGSGHNFPLGEAPEDRTPMETAVRAWMRLAYGVTRYCWAFAAARRAVFVERLIRPVRGQLLDIIFYCCRGNVVFCVATLDEKQASERVAFFRDTGERIALETERADYRRQWLTPDFRLPKRYSEAVAVARRLSADFDFMRVDIMHADGELYAGEMTVYPGSGYGAATRLDLYRAFDDAWDLRRSWFLRVAQRGWRGVYARALMRTMDRQAHKARAAEPRAGMALPAE